MNPDVATSDLIELLEIHAAPGEEAPVADHIRAKLARLGAAEDAFVTDQAHAQSEIGGNCGNLIVRFGTPDGSAPLRMLAAHMDTVPIARDAKPSLEGTRIVNDNPDAALGGDDRTGCAILLAAGRAWLAADNPPPLVLVFAVQEEIGLVGARGLDTTLLGPSLPEMGFEFDVGRVDEVINAIIGTERFNIEITGIASHAGISPADGVSAAMIAAAALAELNEAGWHGRIEKDDGCGTANVGILEGGSGTNVVMPKLLIRCEARSHDTAFRRKIIEQYQSVFTRVVETVANAAGERGSVRFLPGPSYAPCRVPADAPVVLAAVAAVERRGLTAKIVPNDGGMDTNWYNAHGIPTVSLGCGQNEIHTVGEWIDLEEFHAACHVAEYLATCPHPGKDESDRPVNEN